MYVNATKDRTASEYAERVARAVHERARRLEILDRQAQARREAEDRRLEEAGRRKQAGAVHKPDPRPAPLPDSDLVAGPGMSAEAAWPSMQMWLHGPPSSR